MTGNSFSTCTLSEWICSLTLWLIVLNSRSITQSAAL